MTRFIALASFVASASFLVACSAPPAVGAASSAIINGTDDTGDPAVVMLLAQVAGSMNASLCTGELVSPHVVLTAAHCVDPATIGTGATVYVFPGAQLPASPTLADFLTVKETHFDTAFNANDAGSGHDVGVAILTSPLTIAPMPYNRTAIPQTMVGSPARIIGYGITSGTDTMGTSAGTRRTAPTTLANLDNLFVDLQDGSHNICEGDSGGPALMMFNGTERIVGITSFGYSGCPLTVPTQPGAPPEWAGNDTRIDTYASFIDQWVLMFDPPAKGPGTMCSSDADCTPLSCKQTSVGKVCEQDCDPAAMPSTCPAGTTCTDVDGTNLCLAPTSPGGTVGSGGSGGTGGAKGGGCDVGGRAPIGGGALLVASLLMLLGLRRRVRR